MVQPADITEWLARWRLGDSSGEAEVVRRIYPVVRAIAQQQVGRIGSPVTMQATELAHEALIEFARQRGVPFNDRRHLFAVVARIIRCTLIDYLRERAAQKRGGDASRISIDDIAPEDIPGAEVNHDWLALDQALEDLAAVEPRQVELIELRYFTGLSIEDAADVLDISRSSAVREWRFARAWLADRLGAGSP